MDVQASLPVVPGNRGREVKIDRPDKIFCCCLWLCLSCLSSPKGICFFFVVVVSLVVRLCLRPANRTRRTPRLCHGIRGVPLRPLRPLRSLSIFSGCLSYLDWNMC